MKRKDLAEKKRAATAEKLAKALHAAVAATQEYIRACNDCADGSGDERMGAGDGRHGLIRSMAEYAVWLDGKKQ